MTGREENTRQIYFPRLIAGLLHYHLGRFDDGILLFVLDLCHKEKRLQEFSKILCTQFPHPLTCVGRCWPENLLGVASEIVGNEVHNLSWKPPQLM